jgi:hypothetical protein
MNEVASQADGPERFGKWVPFEAQEKCQIEAAGKALIRGEATAVELLIAAASPLCVIDADKFCKRYKRLWDRRDDFRKEAGVAIAKAVASLDKRFRNGHLKELETTFRAYLSKCIWFHLIRYSRQSDKAERDERAQSFKLEDSGLDWVEILKLKPIEIEVYLARERGKKWKEIAASIKRTTRQAQRIFNRVKEKGAA